MKELRGLPSVDRILQEPQAKGIISRLGKTLFLQALNSVLTDIRQDVIEGIPSTDWILSRSDEICQTWIHPTLESVVNATGVILHTNLGRSPLSESALQAVIETAAGYCTLEYDLETGIRGSRQVHAQELLTRLIHCEDSLVVTNNASAVLLALTALGKGKIAAIARSQLVEIGGGFRIPDVMKQSGVKLLEIGTTNRVHLEDYQEALKMGAAIILRAHSSNFRIIGFTSEPDLAEISIAAHQHDAIVIDDLGSGALIDTTLFGLGHEPTVQESLQAGADVICFSGDKLLGGPQAGILIGRKALLAKIRKHPLARAVRADKLCLAALAATLGHYLKEEAISSIPIWRMISRPLDDIKSTADRWCAALGKGRVVAAESTIGGGSLPGEVLPTYVLEIPTSQPGRTLSMLRLAKPPIIGRVWQDKVILDPRTVFPAQEDHVLDTLRTILNKGSQ